MRECVIEREEREGGKAREERGRGRYIEGARDLRAPGSEEVL
jgi:hypothetical protein